MSLPDTCYFTASRVRPSLSSWDPRRHAAEVLHGTYRGMFVALTILVRGSSWVCHPQKDKTEWHRRNRYGGARARLGQGRPPRRIRKAAKLALRRFTEESWL